MSFKVWVLITIFLFGLGIILGAVVPHDVAGIISQDVEALNKLAETIAALPRPLAVVVILGRNAFTLLISFALSPILCLPPLVALITNGWLLAIVSSRAIQEKSLGFLLAGLLPHGIIEIPAFILGQAVALSFGVAVILAPFNRERRKQLLPTLKQNLKYLTIALVLLLPAALIEIYITPLFLSAFG